MVKFIRRSIAYIVSGLRILVEDIDPILFRDYLDIVIKVRVITLEQKYLMDQYKLLVLVPIIENGKLLMCCKNSEEIINPELSDEIKRHIAMGLVEMIRARIDGDIKVKLSNESIRRNLDLKSAGYTVNDVSTKTNSRITNCQLKKYIPIYATTTDLKKLV